MKKKQVITLSKDLPGQRVSVPEGSEKKSYYKYYLEPFEDISPELKAELRASEGKLADTLEPEDRNKLFDVKCWPPKSGMYPLRRGGLLVASNVKIPDITADAVKWWGTWHGLDPLRYALWDPQDHYDITLDEASRARALDQSIPVDERLWGMRHKVVESMDQETPDIVEMEFMNPFKCGFDESYRNTDRCMSMLSAKAVLGGKIPVFMTEVVCKDENGVTEIRMRFWIGYQLQPDGTCKCKIPRFIKIPRKIASNLMIHNHREFKRLNQILPRLYEEQKDNWEE